MSTRTRQTLGYTVTGITNRFGQYDAGHSIADYSKTTTDVVGLGDNQEFHSIVRSYEGMLLNAPYQGWAYVNWINKLADAVQYQGLSFGHLSVSGIPPYTDLAVTAAARTTPSRPYVDVPVEALQLGDLVKDIKSLGDNLFRRFSRGVLSPASGGAVRTVQAIGNTNLMWQFDILPLAEDLKKILDFQEQVERRVKELERLRSARGLRRTIKLGDLGDYEALTPLSPWNPQSADIYITAYYTARTRVRLGAHCRWKPTMDLSGLTPSAKRELARKAVLGLTFDGSSAWQLIPWTWLIDWCISIGDWFKANRNIVPAQLESVSILKHTRSEYHSNELSFPYGGVTVTLSRGLFLAEDKERIPTVAIPVAHFPFLSENQLGILGSLAITGRKTR